MDLNKEFVAQIITLKNATASQEFSPGARAQLVIGGLNNARQAALEDLRRYSMSGNKGLIKGAVKVLNRLENLILSEIGTIQS